MYIYIYVYVRWKLGHKKIPWRIKFMLTLIAVWPKSKNPLNTPYIKSLAKSTATSTASSSTWCQCFFHYLLSIQFLLLLQDSFILSGFFFLMIRYYEMQWHQMRWGITCNANRSFWVPKYLRYQSMHNFVKSTRT